MSRWILAGLMLGLVGCATTYSRGRKIAEQGRFEEASRYWMAALDEDELAKGPRKGLDQYGSSAVWVYMEIAEEHETEMRFEQAIATYGQALSMANDLVAYDVDPGLDRIELDALIVDIEDRLATYRYDQGVAAAERREFDAAIVWWEQARDMRPDYSDTTERIGRAHLEAGHDALAARQYPDALDQWSQAMTWGQGSEARAWSDVTAIALGRYYLTNGACRSAFELFDGARATANDSSLDESIALAEDCSRVEVVVSPFERAEGGPLTELDVPAVVTDSVTESIRANASRYLRIVDPMLATDVPNTFGHRFAVRGRLTQVQYERPEAVTLAMATDGKRQITCPPLDGYGDYSDELCDETVTLTADLTTAEVSLGLIGSVRVSDPRTGELMTTRSLDQRTQQTTRTRSAFRLDGTRVATGETATQAIYAVDPNLLSIPTTSTPLPDDATLLRLAGGALGQSAAEAILAVIDVEPQPQAPRYLDIPTPVTDASQIEFGEGVPTEQGTPTRAVIRNRPE
jgi:tetratricopeptide (TPR) repeat protein